MERNHFLVGLNPYSTGSWVAGWNIMFDMYMSECVLILILLEVGLLVRL